MLPMRIAGVINHNVHKGEAKTDLWTYNIREEP